MKDIKTFNEQLRKLNSDSAVRTQFFNEHYGEIKAHTFWKFGKFNDWEDLAHDVVRKLIETDWSNYPYIEFPASWLNSVIDNYAYDVLRHNSRVYSMDTFALEAFSLDETIMDSNVRDALKKLSKDIQYIIYAHYWEGYTYIEIANQLGLTPVNVRVKAFRAQQILKLKL